MNPADLPDNELESMHDDELRFWLREAIDAVLPQIRQALILEDSAELGSWIHTEYFRQRRRDLDLKAHSIDYRGSRATQEEG